MTPRGAGWGRGRGGRRRRRRRVRSFLQPCLLLMLKNGSAHGYNLLSDLEKFGFDVEMMDASVVYRTLRDMEDMGWVSSEWDEEDSLGPQRRVYRLTHEGESALGTWVEDLRGIKKEIDTLLETYNRYTGE